MSFSDTPQKLEAVLIQRNESNTYYEQINVSGSNMLSYFDEHGKVNVDTFTTLFQKYSFGNFAITKSISTNYTASLVDDMIFIDANNVTVLLSSSSSLAGKKYTLTQTVAGTSKISGSANINNQIGYVLTGQYKYVSLISNGIQWFIIGSN